MTHNSSQHIVSNWHKKSHFLLFPLYRIFTIFVKDTIHDIQCTTYSIWRTVCDLQYMPYSVRLAVYDVQCTTYSIWRTVYDLQYMTYSVRLAVYDVQCTTCSILRTVYDLQYMTYSVRLTVYDVQCTTCSIWRTVYDLQYMTYSVRLAVYGVQCTTYSIWRIPKVRLTIYEVRYTSYSIRFTVYGVPCKRRTPKSYIGIDSSHAEYLILRSYSPFPLPSRHPYPHSSPTTTRRVPPWQTRFKLEYPHNCIRSRVGHLTLSI